MLKKHFGFRERKHDFSAISTLDGLHQQFIFILIRFKFIYPTDEKAFFLKTIAGPFQNKHSYALFSQQRKKWKLSSIFDGAFNEIV